MGALSLLLRDTARWTSRLHRMVISSTTRGRLASCSRWPRTQSDARAVILRDAVAKSFPRTALYMPLAIFFILCRALSSQKPKATRLTEFLYQEPSHLSTMADSTKVPPSVFPTGPPCLYVDKSTVQSTRRITSPIQRRR